MEGKDKHSQTAKTSSNMVPDLQDQDHYAVLGLKKYRFRATDEDVKRACN